MNTLTKLLAATMTLSAQAMAATPLTLDVYNANGNSFHVNATVVYGETEAMVVDTGFTKADALRIGAKVLFSGKTLKPISSLKRIQTTTLEQKCLSRCSRNQK